MADDTIHLALIGDLIGSRELEDREEVQERLFHLLDVVNERFSKSIRSRFVVTIGDEFQGLLAPRAPVEEIWWAFAYEFFPETPIRFGFGAGRLSTNLRDEAIGMDGPCFHIARAALDRAHESSHFMAFGVEASERLGPAFDRIWALPDRTLKHWTPTQWKSVSGLAVLGTQQKVAEARGVSQQSVQGSISGAGGLELMDSLSGLLTLYREVATGS